MLNSSLRHAALIGSSIFIALSQPATATDIIVPPNATSITLHEDDNLIVKSDGKVGGSSVFEAVSARDITSIGYIHNSGLIGGYIGGIGITNTNVTRGIINNGEITGYHGGLGIGLSATIDGGILNNGKIDSSLYGLIVTTHSVINGGIINLGSILGQLGGIYNINTSSINDGIINNGWISEIINEDFSSINGGITNTVEISGILNDKNAMISDGIKNSGEIYRIANDRVSSISGPINNSGLIRTLMNNRSSAITGGIQNYASLHEIVNTNSSLIQGGIINDKDGVIGIGSHGIDNNRGSSIDNIINRGTISGSIWGIYNDPTSLITGSITNSGAVSGGTGAIQFGDDDNALILQTGSTLTGLTDGGGGEDTLTLEGTGSEDDSFVNFENLIMNGEDWSLTSALTLLPGISGGTVTINSGTLRINDTLTAPGGIMAAGGALGGSGNVIAPLNLGNGASLSPGNSIGTLSIIGDVTFGVGSHFIVEVDGTLTDLLEVDGNVSIDPQAVLDVVPLSGYVDVQDQTIIQATGSIDANFQNIETLGDFSRGLVAATKIIGGNEMLLSMLRPTGQNASIQASLQDGFSMQEAMLNGAGRSITSDKNIWLLGLADSNQWDGTDIFAGFKQDTKGVSFGGDRAIGSNLRLGLSFGYTESDVDQIAPFGNIELQSLHGGAYGLYSKESVTLSFGAHIGVEDIDFNRSAITSGITSNIESSTDGYLAGLYGKASFAHDITANWQGFFNLSLGYVHQSQDGFTDESGLIFDDIKTNIIRTGPSIDVVGSLQTGTVLLRPRFSVGWQKQWMSGDDNVAITFGSGSSTKAALADLDDSFATLGLGLDAIFENGLTAFAAFKKDRESNADRKNLSVGLRLGF